MVVMPVLLLLGVVGAAISLVLAVAARSIVVAGVLGLATVSLVIFLAIGV